MNLLKTPPTVVRIGNEEAFHAPNDFLRRSNLRKDIVIVILGALLVFSVLAIIKVSLRPKETYVVGLLNGVEYLLSSPAKPLSTRDRLVYNQIKQDLSEFVVAYFTRSLLTADRDIAKAPWFLYDPAANQFRADALGTNGWVAGLKTGRVPETHIHVRDIILRDSELQNPPYHAVAQVIRTFQGQSPQQLHVDLNFSLTSDVKGPMPLYNALGLFIVGTPEETVAY